MLLPKGEPLSPAALFGSSSQGQTSATKMNHCDVAPTPTQADILSNRIEAIHVRVRFVEGALDQAASLLKKHAPDQQASQLRDQAIETLGQAASFLGRAFDQATSLLTDQALDNALDEADSTLSDKATERALDEADSALPHKARAPQEARWLDTLKSTAKEIREIGLNEPLLAARPAVKFLQKGSNTQQFVTYEERQYFEFCYVVCYDVCPEIFLLMAYRLSEKTLRSSYNDKVNFIHLIRKNKEELSCEVLRKQARKLKLCGAGM